MLVFYFGKLRYYTLNLLPVLDELGHVYFHGLRFDLSIKFKDQSKAHMLKKNVLTNEKQKITCH